MRLQAEAAFCVIGNAPFNHPSGDCLPSDEDLRLTERLAEAGQIIGIHVIDHIIVGEDSYYSFSENGLL